MVSFPFDSQNGDRRVTSTIFRHIFRKYFTNGVFMNPSTELQVLAKSGNTVTIKKGYININGAISYTDVDIDVQLDASGSQPRYDRIVMQLNDNVDVRNIREMKLKGAESSAPIAPALTRNSSVHEMCLATIYRPANSSAIKQSDITDTRMDVSVCGVVSGTVKEADTKTLYAQIQADLNGFKTDEQASFMKWFETIKGILDSEMAGHLQLEIADIEKDIVDINSQLGQITQTAKKTTRDLEQTASDLEKLSSDTQCINVKYSFSSNTGDITLPTGFTPSNTCIIGIMYHDMGAVGFSYGVINHDVGCYSVPKVMLSDKYGSRISLFAIGGTPPRTGTMDFVLYIQKKRTA